MAAFGRPLLLRVKARGLPHARFETADFVDISFEGYDVIAAIECLYYLTPEHQAAFFDKVARDHPGKILIVSAPIIGANEHRRYYTHQELLEIFLRHRMTPVAFHNVAVYRRTVLATIPAAVVRVPFGESLLDLCQRG
jgi:hypothetical protein